jgi:hypothetical protein
MQTEAFCVKQLFSAFGIVVTQDYLHVNVAAHVSDATAYDLDDNLGLDGSRFRA